MIKTILVAYDGSNHAEKALSFAADLASKYRARLVLLHALLRDAPPERIRKLAKPRDLPARLRDLLKNYEIEPQIAAAAAGTPTVYVPVPAPRELLEAVGKQILERGEAAAKKAKVTRVSKVMVSGDPAEAIVSRAKREKADMIVMGSRGFGNLKSLLLGSVSHEVASKSSKTVVTVK
jgi:nucleotide-binding universal stress UspA family protein